MNPQLTTVATPIQDLAEKAVDLLLERIRKNGITEEADIMLPVELQQGQSVKRL